MQRPDPPTLKKTSRASAGAAWILLPLSAALAIWFGTYFSNISTGQVFSLSVEWAPSIGLALAFRLDALSALFALGVTGIGALVILYARVYLGAHRHAARFHLALGLFMLAMLGLVLADNLLLLYLFWELTTLASFFLIGFEHERAEARRAAQQALLVTVLGGLALLAGLLLLAGVSGTFSLSEILGRGDEIRKHPHYPALLILILFGAFTKSAQVPFHSWLPAAMEAPTPASAYLHAATMVKAGVYLLARLSPALAGTAWWSGIVVPIGAITMVVGAIGALWQKPLKRVLAYSTVSALGLLVFLLGIGTPAAIRAALVYLVAHALYKGALFLTAGALDRETGERDLDRLGGLKRAMPITAAASVLAAFSMAGVPPLIGFLGKDLLFAATWPGEGLGPALLVVAFLGSVFFVVIAVLAGVRPFFGTRTETSSPPHETSPALWIGPLVLAGGGLMLGLVPSVLAPLLDEAGRAMGARTLRGGLEPWHQVTPQLALSGVALLVGVAFSSKVPALRSWFDRWSLRRHLPNVSGYDLAMAGVAVAAERQTRLLQSGYLRSYLLVALVTTVGLLAHAVAVRQPLELVLTATDFQAHEFGLALLILCAAFVATRSETRFGAILAMGVVGFGVAVIFVLFGAPDLAMTQFAVETLTVLLFVLAFYHLPRFARLSSRKARARDVVLCGAFGALMAGLVLATAQAERSHHVAEFYSASSVPLGHGRNVVNLILTDFRSLDTLGEITVLAIAAFGVLALLRLRMERRERA